MSTFKAITGPILALLLLGSGFRASAAQPSDLAVIYETSNGTVAPQFYEVRRITIHSAGEGSLLVIKGTDSTGMTESTTAFASDAQKLKLLMAYIRSKHFDVPPRAAQVLGTRKPGDGSCSLKFLVHGNAYALPCDARDVPILLDMIREMAPLSSSSAQPSP